MSICLPNRMRCASRPRFRRCRRSNRGIEFQGAGARGSSGLELLR
jgi:hypothetical protein